MKKSLLFIAGIMALISCSNHTEADNDTGNSTIAVDLAPPLINYNIVNIYPHDTAAFTEGLLIDNGRLYESTGGQPQDNDFHSWVSEVDLKTGRATKKIMLDTSYFGEGISIIDGKMYQLTWKNQKGFVYDPKTLKKLKDFSYKNLGWDNEEGWALTNDGTHLILSDGTNKLRFIDPATLKILKITGVEDNNGPVGNINELEYINGYVYANQWGTNYILKIDPASGKVAGKLDFTPLYNEVKMKYPGALEMNGIAYDSATKKIYITGKAWPSMYEVRF